MTSPSDSAWSRPHLHRHRARSSRQALAWLVALAVSIAVALVGMSLAEGSSDTVGPTAPSGTSAARTAIAWPAGGQAALSADGRLIGTSGSNQPVPIASLAKMMTAYLVLLHHPDVDGDALTIDVSPAIVHDTAARRLRGESVVAVRAGERLDERGALTAILLPSANNVAVALAARDAGSVPAFVTSMNRTAWALGMHATRYTDPSGYDPGTVSTAHDQLRLTAVVMAMPAFADIVRRTYADLPVAGRVRNTNTLLGHDGFVGTKTGSDSAAGGCFAFMQLRRQAGLPTVTIIGVVLGQRDGALLPSALAAARRLTESLGSV